MNKVVSGFILGALLASVVWWFMGRADDGVQAEVATLQAELNEARVSAREALDAAARDAQQAAEQASRSMTARIEALQLDAASVMEDMERSGKVVRRRARALAEEAIDEASDTASTARIKAAIAADPDLSAFDISVATSNGVVTLSGELGSVEEIAHAMGIALATEGVNEVVSTLQIRQREPESEAA